MGQFAKNNSMEGDNTTIVYCSLRTCHGSEQLQMLSP